MLFIATSNSLIRVLHECLPAVRQVKALVLKITESRSTLFTRVLEPGGTGRSNPCCQRNDPDRDFRNEHFKNARVCFGIKSAKRRVECPIISALWFRL